MLTDPYIEAVSDYKRFSPSIREVYYVKEVFNCD